AYKFESDFAAAESTIRNFINTFGSQQGGQRVFVWQEDTKVNFGFLVEVNGIVENHYISIEVG
ncbi:MAG: hypothetical protein ACRD98_12040, partial [Nitrososphaera sp.]